MFPDAAPSALPQAVPDTVCEVLDNEPTVFDAAPDVASYEQHGVARFRGLFGLPNGNIEPFGAIGVAITGVDFNYLVDPRATLVGLTVGAGVNIALAPNFYIRPEVLYDIYGTHTFPDGVSIGLNTFTARVAALIKLPP